jgi:hypothetical protein
MRQLPLFVTRPSTIAAITAIRLDRDIDREKPCCENIATIGSSTAMHAGRLTCSCCGAFRGWLPAAAIPFMNKVRNSIGTEMPVLQSRTPNITENDMAREAHQSPDDNRGALFKNPKKEEGDERPNYTGTITANGSPMWLSAWIQKSKAGETYMSLALRPKETRDDAKRPKSSGSQPSQGSDMDKEIPFAPEIR